MAHQLIHEVYDHAPPDLSPAEAHVLTVIAYHCQVDARSCWMSAEEMQARARLSATGLRKVMQRLADRGLECRVQQATGKDGKPVYAYRGRTTTYRLPRFPVPEGCTCRRTHDAAPRPKGDPAAARTAPKGDPHGSATQRNGDTHGSPSGEKGDPVGAERRPPGVAQYERTKRTPVGTTEVTTRRARPDAEPAPASIPQMRPAPEPAPATAGPAGPSTESHCRRPGCPAPAACGPCARARGTAEAAADAAAEAAAAQLADLDRQRHLTEQRRLRELAEQPRRPYESMSGFQQCREIAAQAAASATGGRHRLREDRPPPRIRERVPA